MLAFVFVSFRLLLLETSAYSGFALVEQRAIHLPNSSLEITIVCRHNIDTVLDDPINKTVIGICTLVIALDSLEARVFGNAQCQAVLLAEFLQLGDHAVGDDRRAFGVEAVHHGGNDFQLVLDGMGDKIGIDEDGVGRCQGGVILEEKRRRSLGSAMEKRPMSVNRQSGKKGGISGAGKRTLRGPSHL